MVNLNILSQRYATPEMNAIFSEKGKIVAERDLWIGVMKAQRELGVDIPEDVIMKYGAAREEIDLDRIAEIERVRKHDVKARLEAFNEAAGVSMGEQHAHKRMTSRDLTDNVEQMQFRKAAELIFGKYVSVLRHLTDKAEEYSGIFLTSRTHMQPAQVTLLGRRFSMWAEELLAHLHRFESYIQDYSLRGIKGPVGTQSDMLDLLRDEGKVKELDRIVANELGFTSVLESTGQVYPRSLDSALLSNLMQLSSGPANFANTIRVMARGGLVNEGFKEGQVGSTAMPHKMNARTAERIGGFANLLKMYANGASLISGDQWDEGDVSDSVVRRVIIPDAFYASDGLCEATMTITNEMGPYEFVISSEVDKYLPFLASTQILGLAIEKGLGREEAHDVIKRHSVAAALAMRDGKPHRLVERLAEDLVFSKAGISYNSIAALILERERFIGSARRQIDSIRSEAKEYCKRFPEAVAYEPRDIL